MKKFKNCKHGCPKASLRSARLAAGMASRVSRAQPYHPPRDVVDLCGSPGGRVSDYGLPLLVDIVNARAPPREPSRKRPRRRLAAASSSSGVRGGNAKLDSLSAVVDLTAGNEGKYRSLSTGREDKKLDDEKFADDQYHKAMLAKKRKEAEKQIKDKLQAEKKLPSSGSSSAERAKHKEKIARKLSLGLCRRARDHFIDELEKEIEKVDKRISETRRGVDPDELEELHKRFFGSLFRDYDIYLKTEKVLDKHKGKVWFTLKTEAEAMWRGLKIRSLQRVHKYRCDTNASLKQINRALSSQKAKIDSASAGLDDKIQSVLREINSLKSPDMAAGSSAASSSGAPNPFEPFGQCVICMDAPNDTVTSPCGHVYCYNCVTNVHMSKCAFCKVKIKKVIRIKMS